MWDQPQIQREEEPNPAFGGEQPGRGGYSDGGAQGAKAKALNSEQFTYNHIEIVCVVGRVPRTE